MKFYDNKGNSFNKLYKAKLSNIKSLIKRDKYTEDIKLASREEGLSIINDILDKTSKGVVDSAKSREIVESYLKTVGVKLKSNNDVNSKVVVNLDNNTIELFDKEGNVVKSVDITDHMNMSTALFIQDIYSNIDKDMKNAEKAEDKILSETEKYSQIPDKI